MKKSFVRGTWQKSRAFSPAVITEGGKAIWIAGHTGQKDSAGNSLAGDFDAQMRQTFKNIEATLKEAVEKPLLVPILPDADGHPGYVRDVMLLLQRVGYRDQRIPLHLTAGTTQDVRVKKMVPSG